MLFNPFKKIKITYGITVCNEATELDTLLAFLIPAIDNYDEIIVLKDSTSENAAVANVVYKYKDSVIYTEAKLNNDFATFKNNLLLKATGDYLFQIDADEVPKPALIAKIKRILRRKYKRDLFLVPRINIVYGLTHSHVEKWNWKLDNNNRVNYPDYQSRILKLNGSIRWKNKVHEELFNFKKSYYLPAKKDEYCLLHVKDINKQEAQNDFYDTIP